MRSTARPLPAHAATGVALLLLLAACSAGADTTEESAATASAKLESRVAKLEKEVRAFEVEQGSTEAAAETEHATAAGAEHKIEKGHFTYEGEAGPANWAELDAAWETCATGEAQSPTNLTGGLDIDLTDAVFSYKPSAVTAVNNGHTVCRSTSPTAAR